MSAQKFEIRIPKPCHEDWGRMTPDAKGAFCASCQKSVYDFTGKTDEEIAEVFLQNQGQKICGRFNAAQVSRPFDIRVPLTGLPRNASPARAFAMALFLVFGTMLFSCQTVTGQVMGDVAIEIPAEKNTVKGEMILTGDTVLTQTPVVTGKSKVTTVTGKNTVSKCTLPANNKPLGEAQFLPEDTMKRQAPLPADTMPEQELIMGKMVFLPVEDHNNQAVETAEVVTDPEIKQMPYDSLNADNIQAYPNPTGGELNMRYTISTHSVSFIEIYDMNGKLVKTLLMAQKLYPGTYHSQFSISDLEPGTYICVLNSGGKTASTRLTMAE
ncbi:MAG: T9SS type A sorting domain-containing protein [Bacteroidota bacterium]